MNKLSQMMRGGGQSSKFRGALAKACLVAASLGVVLMPSGQALAMDYGPVYGNTSGVMTAQMVKVVDVRQMVREVEMPHSSFNTSRVMGGAIGAALGNKVGQGKGKTLATILGAGMGQAVGDEVDKKMDKKEIPVTEISFILPGKPDQIGIVVQDSSAGLAECRPGMTAILVNNREISRCLVSADNLAQARQPAAATMPVSAPASATDNTAAVPPEKAKALFDDLTTRPKKTAGGPTYGM